MAVDYYKKHDLDRAGPAHEVLTDLDAANLQIRLVHDYNATMIGSNAINTRYRCGAYEHVFAAVREQKLARGLEGLGLFDPSLAGANQPSLF